MAAMDLNERNRESGPACVNLISTRALAASKREFCPPLNFVRKNVCGKTR